MSNFSIANKIGLLEHNLKNLYHGKADIGTASKLGVLTHSLQEFIDGKANIAMAMKLEMMTSDLQLMLNSIGREGAIGLVLGLLIKIKKM